MNKHACIITIAGFALSCCVNSKILIITHSYNRPEFINHQYQTFKKFLKDEYEFVVFNDAPNDLLASQIRTTCNDCSIKCLRIPQENRIAIPENPFSWGSTRHAQAVQYSLEVLGFDYDGILMIIDSDMFLIKDFSVTDYMNGYDMAGLAQIQDQKIKYLWPALLFLRMDALPNKKTMRFSPGQIDGVWVDSGGYLHYYLKENPQLKIRYFEQEGRFLLNENLRAYIWKNEATGNRYKPYYLQCSQCKKSPKNCPHRCRLMHELGFDKKIIEYVQSKQIPPDCELVLHDTFFHYKRGSNYFEKSDQCVINKTTLFNRFITDILNSPCT